MGVWVVVVSPVAGAGDVGVCVFHLDVDGDAEVFFVLVLEDQGPVESGTLAWRSVFGEFGAALEEVEGDEDSAFVRYGFVIGNMGVFFLLNWMTSVLVLFKCEPRGFKSCLLRVTEVFFK